MFAYRPGGCDAGLPGGHYLVDAGRQRFVQSRAQVRVNGKELAAGQRWRTVAPVDRIALRNPWLTEDDLTGTDLSEAER